MQIRARIGAAGALALLAAGCGGGGAADPPAPPVDGDGDAAIVSGQVTYDRVPHTVLGGLDYAATAPAPVRGAVIEAIVADGGTTLASSVTDGAGNYSLQVPADTDIRIRVKAQLERTGVPGWDFTVVDNTSGDALYVLDGSVFDVGSGPDVRNLHAASGWGGTSYTGPRAAAPFSILDAVYDSVQLVLGADPLTQFPPLELNWSPANRPAGPFDPDAGDIVTSSFVLRDGVGEIYLLGAADNDTDEFDQHVIAHEWGHYYENAFSRSDSIGGPHGVGDYLDMRVAFGEGWGNAFSGMSLGDPVYRDSIGELQSEGFFIDLEDNDSPNPGWYSEFSVQAILYDLFDAANEGLDSLTLGFGPIHDVLTTAQRQTDALTSIFSFIPALKDANPAVAANIDALVMEQSIDSVGMDELGSGETNDAGNPDLLPIYLPLAVGAGSVNACSLGGEKNPPQSYGSINKLGNSRFLRFTLNAPGLYTFAAAGAADTDPDLVLHQMGIIAVSDGTMPGLESFSRQLGPGDYVLEVYEFRNITEDPRGETCFDVSIN